MQDDIDGDKVDTIFCRAVEGANKALNPKLTVGGVIPLTPPPIEKSSKGRITPGGDVLLALTCGANLDQ